MGGGASKALAELSNSEGGPGTPRLPVSPVSTISPPQVEPPWGRKKPKGRERTNDELLTALDALVTTAAGYERARSLPLERLAQLGAAFREVRGQSLIHTSLTFDQAQRALMVSEDELRELFVELGKDTGPSASINFGELCCLEGARIDRAGDDVVTFAADPATPRTPRAAVSLSHSSDQPAPMHVIKVNPASTALLAASTLSDSGGSPKAPQMAPTVQAHAPPTTAKPADGAASGGFGLQSYKDDELIIDSLLDDPDLDDIM